MIHTLWAGRSLTGHIAFTPWVVEATHAALAAGAPILCDSLDGGRRITAARLPAANEVVSLVADPRRRPGRAAGQIHRSRGRVRLWADRLGAAVLSDRQRPDGVPAVELIDDGCPSTGLGTGRTGGFVGSAQSKDELIADPRAWSIWWCSAGAGAVRWRPPR